MDHRMKGIFVALVTPYRRDGSVDHAALRDLIRLQLSYGVDGLFLTGTTGEVFLLTEEERKRIVELAVQEAAGKAMVVAQTGAFSTDATIALTRHARDAGADAVSVLPPLYFRYQPKQVVDFYREVTNAVDIPMLVYDIPANTGMDLTKPEYAKIFEIPACCGIKASHCDMYALNKMKRTDSKKRVFIGVDECLLGGLSLGADGGIGSTYNILAPYFVTLYRRFTEGDFMTAQKIQNLCNGLIDDLIRLGVTPCVKYLLKYFGLPVSNCRRPTKELSAEEKLTIDQSYQVFLAAVRESGIEQAKPYRAANG